MIASVVNKKNLKKKILYHNLYQKNIYNMIGLKLKIIHTFFLTSD